MKKSGFAQIPLMIGLLLMAVAIPVATKLVQTNQENRGKATGACPGTETCRYGISDCGANGYYSGTGTCPGGKCCGGPVPTGNDKCTNGPKYCAGGKIYVCKADKSGYTSSNCASGVCSSTTECKPVPTTAPTKVPTKVPNSPTPSCKKDGALVSAKSECCTPINVKTAMDSRLYCDCLPNGVTIGVTNNAGKCCTGKSYFSMNVAYVCGTQSSTPTPVQKCCCLSDGSGCHKSSSCGWNYWEVNMTNCISLPSSTPVPPTPTPNCQGSGFCTLGGKPCCSGESVPSTSCPSGYKCMACTENTKKCNTSNSKVETCVSGKWTITQSCVYGCSGGVCLSSQSCTNGSTCKYGISDCGAAGYLNGSGTCPGGTCCGGPVPTGPGNCLKGDVYCAAGKIYKCKADKSGYTSWPCASGACKDATTCKPEPTSTPVQNCLSSGTCYTTVKPCCSGYAATVATSDCPSGKKCAPVPTVSPGNCPDGSTARWGSSDCGAGWTKVATFAGGICCKPTIVPTVSPGSCPTGSTARWGSSDCGAGWTKVATFTGGICCKPNPTLTPVPGCMTNACLTKGKSCCYGSTEDTTCKETGKKCKSAPVQPTNTPAPPSNCTDNGLCKKSGVPCCSGNVKVVDTSVCASGKKCVAAAATNTPAPGACTQCPGMPNAKSKGNADCTNGTTLVDFSIWRDEFITGLLGSVKKNTWKADFDCNGYVNLNDFSIWRPNFIKGLLN